MKWREWAGVPAVPAAVAAALGILASVQLASLDIDRQESETRGKVVAEVAAVRARLEGVIKATFSSTDGLVHLVSLQGGISPALFADMARLAIGKNKVIRNITLAPDNTVRLVYPLAGNEKVIGFRYASRPEQMRTVELARERGGPVLIGPLELVQGGRALINRAPVFTPVGAGTAQTRYWGTISIVARVDSLLGAEDFAAATGARIALRGKDGLGSRGGMIAGDAAVFADDPVLMNVPIPGGSWQLGAIPADGWRARPLYRSAYFSFGLVISFLLAYVVGQRSATIRQTRRKNAELQQEVLERQKAEAALREEELRFRTLFESSPDPVWIIEGSRFVECNAAAAAMLGYESGAEMLYVHPARLSPEFQPDGEASYAKAERILDLARAGGVQRFEWVHRRADGSVFPAEVTLSRISMQGKQVIYCVWRDISDRKQDEERLMLAATVLAATAEGVMVTDVDANVVSVNRAFTDITGYTEEEVRGRNPRFHQSERQGPEFYQAMWDSILRGDVWQGEIWNRRKSGELYPAWLTISAIRGGKGQVTNYVGVFSDISSIKRSQDALERLAHFDPLTDLPNRVLYQDRLTHAIDRAQRYDYGIAVLLLDLDGFKTVNDSLGHPAGDRLLQGVARRLKECIRVEDTVARLGGDEFALILANMHDGADAIEVVRKILASIQDPFDLDGMSALVTASIGIAVYPADGLTATELVRNADAAMYGAKEAGRNIYRFYQATMTHKAQARLQKETALRRAIERREFEVWFQPQIGLRSGRLTGAEALVRWRDPERGLVPPAEFVPLAETTGLIVPLGEQVLAQVCAHARRWLDAGLRFGRLAVNVAAPQIERGDFVVTVRRALAAANLPPDCLEIEVTESFIMASAAHAREVLLAIQVLGVTTAVDDFGTGYSSLAYLKELPIDNLKIDRAFVKDLPHSADDVAIARAIIGMGHSLGFKVIAEGIETAEQRAFLHAEGCDEAQGYLISTPLPADAFERWLRDNGAAAEEADGRRQAQAPHLD